LWPEHDNESGGFIEFKTFAVTLCLTLTHSRPSGTPSLSHVWEREGDGGKERVPQQSETRNDGGDQPKPEVAARVPRVAPEANPAAGADLIEAPRPATQHADTLALVIP